MSRFAANVTRGVATPLRSSLLRGNGLTRLPRWQSHQSHDEACPSHVYRLAVPVLTCPGPWLSTAARADVPSATPTTRGGSGAAPRWQHTTFVQGSRRCVLKYHRRRHLSRPQENRAGLADSLPVLATTNTTAAVDTSTAFDREEEVDVILLPMAHAATRDFYDEALTFIAKTSLALTKRLAATTTVGNAAGGQQPPAGGRGGRPASPWDPIKEADELAAALPSPHLKVVVESLSDDEYQRQVEQSEWDLLGKRLVSTDPDDQDATTQFEHLVTVGKLFSQDSIQDMCRVGQLPYPLPAGLDLQDAYFLPLLVSRFAPALINGDIVLSRLEADQPNGSWTASTPEGTKALHLLRERSCVSTVLDLLQRPEVACVVVPWGHFHIPRLADAFLRIGMGNVGKAAAAAAAQSPPATSARTVVAEQFQQHAGSPLDLVDLSGFDKHHQPVFEVESTTASEELTRPITTGINRKGGGHFTLSSLADPPVPYGWTVGLLKQVYPGLETPLFDAAVHNVSSTRRGGDDMDSGSSKSSGDDPAGKRK